VRVCERVTDSINQYQQIIWFVAFVLGFHCSQCPRVRGRERRERGNGAPDVDAHVYVYIQIYIYIYICLYIWIYIYLYVYICIYTHTYIYIYIYKYIYIYIYVYIYEYIYTYMYIYVYIHTHIYIYIHICIYRQKPESWVCIGVCMLIDWFWDPLFHTNWDVRDVDKLSPGTFKSITDRSQFKLQIGKRTLQVQIARLWFNEPFQNRLIDSKAGREYPRWGSSFPNLFFTCIWEGGRFAYKRRGEVGGRGNTGHWFWEVGTEKGKNQTAIWLTISQEFYSRIRPFVPGVCCMWGE